MNFFIVAVIAVVLIGLRWFKPNALVWFGAFWLALYLILNYGINPPPPASIRGMYLGIITAALLLYVSADAVRAAAALAALKRLTREKKFLPLVVILLLVFPISQALGTWKALTSEVMPPPSGRTIHPAPPQSISFQGKTIDVLHDRNPLRSLEKQDPNAFKQHVAAGRAVYYRNCVFCHGDNLQGDGLYAHGLDPIPANFNDPTTIGMLTETYLFWRISKGGPGLPEEGTPWLTAMPAWEDKLKEEQIWEVILFLYDFTGLKPRSMEKVE